ncbi:hypothetical protein L7E55_02025 [Pelotomaculum isophthalicicum JI]|uniref:Uncharacterized protein n=1 Tax=Pelotomaculum isophthalicicum JI TaxID=947010 RepID=A0A9X4H6S0_9FIRM|nr:hypothetical protein [Pelotomaculum isophthalicicum]MDF9407144.1 hypothetical protein [Pelotomaculum isophthalicicum JI]
MIKEMGLPVLSENYVLQILLQESDKFINFYKNERHKIRVKVNWAFDERLNSQIKSIGLENPDTKEIEYVVIIKQVPIQFDDAFDTAHELQHLILNQEGFPSLCYINNTNNANINLVNGMNDLACRISKSINDPLVNSRLVKYNFDLWDNYDRVSKAQMPFMQSIKNIFPNEPSKMEGKAFIASTFIQAVLDWEVACRVSPNINNNYIKNLSSMFPVTTKETEDILALIKAHGYDSPDKASIIFYNITQKYGLGHLFTLPLLNI